jgi:pSer/pThr/pTyr-binding forkhead associated (FHA) protein
VSSKHPRVARSCPPTQGVDRPYLCLDRESTGIDRAAAVWFPVRRRDPAPRELIPITSTQISDPLARYSLSPAELKELLATEREGEPFLVFRDVQRRLTVVVLGVDGAPRTLGRRSEMDVSIAWDTEVSGLHAELHGFSGEWAIIDDGLSRNGTFVNGQRISGRHRLRDGDRIRVGQTIIVFRSGASAQTEATVSSHDHPALGELTETQRRVLVALCRPYRDDSSFATPATNQQIAEEVFLSVEAVKMHLRTLFMKFELAGLAQNEKRARLAECALQYGVISRRDLA